MHVLHAAVFAYGKAFAGGLEFFLADIRFFARFEALGSAFMGGRHRPVAGDVFFGFFIGVGRCRKGGTRKESGDEEVFFHMGFL